jgi:hypothetical protein
LELGSHFLCRLAWTTVLLFYPSCYHCWDDRCTIPYPAFFSPWFRVSQTFLPRLASNHDSPNLSLPHSLGQQVHTTAPSYWLKWGSHKLFALAGFEPLSSQTQHPR